MYATHPLSKIEELIKELGEKELTVMARTVKSPNYPQGKA